MFGRKKKREVHSKDMVLAEGIYLKTPKMQIGNIVYSCFLRSVIAFLLVLGSVGGFLSALQLSYNYLVVIVAYMLLSLYFSFLYALPKFLYRDMGYIAFFAVFVFAIYTFRIHANSGLYVVVNTVLQRAKTFFNLSGVREYETQIDNDYLTVAIVAIFIGMVLIIILNIWLYSRMSLIWAVGLTFPLLLIPLYMKMVPDMLYMIFLAIGYTMVVIFKANGHYLAFAWDKPFKIKAGKHIRVSYTQDAGVFQHVLVTIMVFTLCISFVLQGVIRPGDFERQFHSDNLREKTADTIGNFILLGFAGLYNQYAAVGGMSAGKLGGVSNVRPDYMTDLIVTYTPYSNQAVYLKAFTGGRYLYRNNEWEDLYSYNEAGSDEDITDFEDESMKQEMLSLQQDSGKYYAQGVMKVKNVGADGTYLYYPYYTQFENYNIFKNHAMFESMQGLNQGATGTYIYYPKIVWGESLGETRPGDIDKAKINDEFLDVPEENADVIKAECKKIGLTDTMTENEITDAVAQYFEDNIPYTLSPGATPRDEDFINFFLTKNRKGYCAHFASAATLIFRQMGIPARYVEGYAFSLESVLASEMNEREKAADYYQGYSAIGDTPVMDVEVTDAMAHAWVEVYIEGFGWKVVEVTPSNSLDTEENNFWDAFTSAMNNLGADGDQTSGILGDLDMSKLLWGVYAIIAVVCLFVLYRMGVIVVCKVMRYQKCHQNDKREAVVARYADLCDRIRLCDKAFDACKSHREQLQYMKDKYGLSLDVTVCCEEMEKISYSGQEIRGQQLVEMLQMIRQVKKAVWKQATFLQRIRLCKR